ncbi:HIST1H1A family protein [Megaselia abdita]
MLENNNKKAVKMNSTVEKRRRSSSSLGEMVDKVLMKLRDRKGTTLRAVKKMFAEDYEVENMKSYNKRISKYIKESLQNNHIVQKTGNGLSGRFQIDIEKSKVSVTPKRERNRNQKLVNGEASKKERKKAAKLDAKSAKNDGVVKSRKNSH